MKSFNLTQEDVNKQLRGLTSAEIIMFSPDENIVFSENAVTSNVTPLTYTTDLQSVVEVTNSPRINMATFEHNSWILDGSFISPSEEYSEEGNSYSGYITDEMTDDNGNYEVNPILTVTFAAIVPEIRYISLQFPYLIGSYPRNVIMRAYDADDNLIGGYGILVETEKQTGMPMLVANVNKKNVKKIEIEFEGTMSPRRRTRLTRILFGKAELVNPDYLQNWSLDDKVSLVADSIPTKQFSYSIINYDGDYDIDNPGNKIPTDYNAVRVLFTFGMECDGMVKYAPTKSFNLLDISTSSDGIVTFGCGSLLDMLTATYDRDIYVGARTLQNIVNDVLIFCDIAPDQCILNEFSSYVVNIPLPEIPVREIIQRLAFSCGATLSVNDDNKIVFSKKYIDSTQSDTLPCFVFTQPDPFESAALLLEEPSAEPLQYTTDIGMYTYNTRVDDTITEVGSANISTITPTKISFSAVSGAIDIDTALLEEQHATLVNVSEVYSQHAIITVSWTSAATLPIKVTIKGRAAKTTKTVPIASNMNTLLLDSGLALTVPDILKRPAGSTSAQIYYTDWYGAKFKYKCKTRKEYLISAGDFIRLETPFSNKQPNKYGYVLRNAYSNDSDSGEMEVIIIEHH